MGHKGLIIAAKGVRNLTIAHGHPNYRNTSILLIGIESIVKIIWHAEKYLAWLWKSRIIARPKKLWMRVDHRW